MTHRIIIDWKDSTHEEIANAAMREARIANATEIEVAACNLQVAVDNEADSASQVEHLRQLVEAHNDTIDA